MQRILSRFTLGFLAGAASHIVFQGALGALYYGIGLIPGFIWNLTPVPPYGVPQTVSLAFWAGLWGILYVHLEPRLTARFGRLPGGLLFGIAPLLGRWLVVLPLKGAPFAEGLVPRTMLVFIGFHLAFGLGLAVIIGVVRSLARPEAVPARA
jgi:hypothetical protein